MSSALSVCPPASPAEREGLVVALVVRGRGVLNAYGQVVFGSTPLGGALILAATLTAPAQGLCGLVGLVGSDAWARVLRRPAGQVDEGFYAFNGLLVGLALGARFEVGPPLVAMMALLTLVSVGVAATLRNLAERYVGVPVLCLPFVVVTWTALLASQQLPGLATLPHEAVPAIAWLPDLFEAYLASLASCFFLSGPVAGALVLAGVLVGSRWSAILTAVGFVCGYVAWLGLGGDPTVLTRDLIGLNFVLVAVAVGGVFVVLTPRVVLLAGLAGAVAALVAAALTALLGAVSLPVLAMPFVLVTQGVLFTLAIGVEASDPRLVRGVPGSPETNLARRVAEARRYPDPAIPVVYPPVMGDWVVTQGPDGVHTHQGLWAHAWDFEVAGDDGRTHSGDGAQIEDYYAWKAPVVAAAAGTVVRVVDAVPDNPPGEVETRDNWGNLVLVAHAGGVFSMLCHLRLGSVKVVEGQAVVAGQVLAEVGNSGRSPVPHLHLHLQRSAEVGAPTCYAELLHYVEATQDGPRYVTHGVPSTGTRLRGVNPDPEVRAALTLAPGRVFEWRVGDRTERWLSDIDALGRRTLRTADGRAISTVFSDHRYTTVLDYQGPRDTLLGLFSLGMARAPYLDEAELRWEDTPSATPFVAPLARLGHELVLPFATVGAVPTTAHIVRRGPLVELVCELDVAAVRGAGRLPDRVAITFAAGLGPVSLTAWRDGAPCVQAEVLS